MKNGGVSFNIPNAFGKYLVDLLTSVPFSEYKWSIDNDEIHILKNNELTDEGLFDDDLKIMQGEMLYNVVKSNTYYLIFVTLRAFPQNGNVQTFRIYKEFLDSDCQIVITVYDCSYVMYWCKDEKLITEIYKYALSKDYKNVKYISEENLFEEKCYIE